MHEQAVGLLDQPLLERPEAAGMLRLSVRTIRRLGKAGDLEEVRVAGNSVRVTAASVRQYIQRNTAQNTRQGASAA